jgi:hypothetical protein
MGFLLKRVAEWRERERRREEEFVQLGHQLEAERRDEINPLSFEEARQRAAGLLADSTEFECTLASRPDDPRLEALAPALRAFFERFEVVSQLPHGLWVARALIRPSEVGLGLIRIGATGDEHVPLTVRANEEIVYELDLEAQAYEEEADLLEADNFPSIYHCVIYFHRRKTLLYR